MKKNNRVEPVVGSEIDPPPTPKKNGKKKFLELENAISFLK
jgi:hypothetical protein